MKTAYKQTDNIPYYEEDMVKHGNLEYLAERCLLDVYYPEKKGIAPAILFFHGGGLVTGEKFIPETLKESGLIVVSANYRLSSERARCPDYLNDAAAAAAWVFRHIAEYGGDPDIVFVSGCSGGGYLAAMIGMVPQYLKQFGESNQRFAGIMPVSGQMTTHLQILNERNHTSGIMPPCRAVIDELAPLYHASADLPPFVFYVGDPKLDWPTRAEENALLATTLTRVAGHKTTELFLFSGFDHFKVSEPAFVLMRSRVFSLGNRLRNRCKPSPLSVGKEEKRVMFQARRGGTEPFGTSASWRHDGAFLYLDVECPEPRMDKLLLGPTLWDGDCIELWMEVEPDIIGQFVVTPDGRTSYYGKKTFSDIEAKAAHSDKAWSIRIKIPLQTFTGVPRLNITRRRMADGDDVYTNWSPVMGESNQELDALVQLEFE